MLSERFINDRQNLLRLNSLQGEMRDQVLQKIKDGIYSFEKVDCPVCETPNCEVLAQKDRYGIHQEVVICTDCGLIRNNPCMTQDSYNEFYEVEYRKLYVGKSMPGDLFFREQQDRGHRIAEFIQKTTGSILKGKCVFEVGCGAGGLLHSFQEHGAEVKGCDLGMEYLEFGREEYGLDLVHGPIDCLSKSKKADVIVYSHVLEHVLDLNQELEKVKSFLNHDGVLYIEVPSVKNIHIQYRNDFLRYLQNAHVYHFTLKSLNNLMEKNGYRLIDGNEVVCALYALSDNQMDIVSDYTDVMAYLNKIEGEKFKRLFNEELIKEEISYGVGKILNSVGLKQFVKKIIGRN